MSLDLQAESLDVKLTGRTVYVPENKIAKLMYYLNCVAVVIQYDRNNKLLEYQDYYLLSDEEEEMVVTLAILFDPKIFIDKKLFLVGEKYVPSGKINQFYEITNNKFGIHVSSEVIIGGVSRKILQFMGCKNSWLEEYYYEPLKDYLDSHPNFLRKKKCCNPNTCDSFCNCCVACFDSCCACCDCGCGRCGKKICCLIFWGIFLVLQLILILLSAFGKK